MTGFGGKRDGGVAGWWFQRMRSTGHCLVVGILSTGGLFGVASVAADSGDTYSVQVGTFSTEKPHFAARMQAFGDVYTTSGPNGWTRYQIGRFGDRGAAKVLLGTLKTAGFGDAFVRQSGASTVNAPALKVEEPLQNVPSGRPSESPGRITRGAVPAGALAWSDLDEWQREQLVYLDGAPYVLRGEEFIPVTGLRR